MRTKSLFYSLSVILALAMLLALPAPVLAEKPPPVEVQILSINDFHGALDPSTVRVSRNPDTFYYAGGAEYISTMLKEREATNPNTIKVTAGDMVGASPLLSAIFHDEPTIQALNLMGFSFSATGNHEFDEGWQELLRLQYGGCHPVDGCFLGVPDFTGAAFQYLSANVIRTDIEETLFPAYSVREIDGVKVAFIGAALELTPTIVVPSGVADLYFAPEVEAINNTVRMLKDEQDVKAFVVLLHDGSGPANPRTQQLQLRRSLHLQCGHEFKSGSGCPDHRAYTQSIQLPGDGQEELRSHDHHQRRQQRPLFHRH